MCSLKLSTAVFCCIITIFAIISLIVFNNVNLTSNIVIDEEFHLIVGETYCKFDFNKWHPKVTTLPGLYVLSTILFGPFGLCSAYWLRLTSLLCSIINIFLFYAIFNFNNGQRVWKNMLSAVNLALLPPLYFFSHLYYTDVPSLTMILFMLFFSEREYHFLASVFGILSVIFRQTNVVWVSLVLCCYVLRELIAVHYDKPNGRIEVTQKELIRFLQTIKQEIRIHPLKPDLQFLLNISCYLTIMISFLVFVYLNDGIVVGDQFAHSVSLNVPQIFYFSLFALFFGWPHFMRYTTSFLRFIRYNRLLLMFIIMISLIIEYFDTVVHPYLLADNRHYTFYIWNRFYGKYTMFRYLITPVYIYSLYVVFAKIYNPNDVTFLVFFIPLTIAVLVPQELFEIRYFLIPYILMRLQMKNVTTLSLILEFLTFIVINIITFHIFFTKTIQWAEYDYPQRLIW